MERPERIAAVLTAIQADECRNCKGKPEALAQRQRLAQDDETEPA